MKVWKYIVPISSLVVVLLFALGVSCTSSNPVVAKAAAYSAGNVIQVHSGAPRPGAPREACCGAEIYIPGLVRAMPYILPSTTPPRAVIRQPQRPAPQRKRTLIVIDPGHGGVAKGAQSNGLVEKTIALDVSRKLEGELNRMGYRTVMTRKSDTHISLYDRVKILNRYSNAIMVSVHFNASTNRSAKGFETYYKNSNARSLASNIQNQLASMRVTQNRGIKTAKFVVIKNTAKPSVLVECGFITNSGEAKIIKQSSFRTRLAQCIARGVASTVN